MARTPTFDARAGRRSAPRLTFDTGSADAYASFAQASGDLARRVGTMADRAAAREGETAGRKAALAATVPSAGLDPAVEAVRNSYQGRQSSSGLFINNGPVPDGARQARGFFERLGYSAEAASAIAGHLQQESNFDTSAVGDQGTAFGVAQWRLDRRDALHQFAAQSGADPTDFETQLAFVGHELSTSEGRAGEALRSAGTIDEAATAMMHFFRPAGYTPDNPAAGHAFENRLAYAQAVLGEASPGAAAQPQSVSVPTAPLEMSENGPAFQLTGREGTIRGDAFNSAAMDIYQDRLMVSVSTDMDALAIRHSGNPQELQGALDEYAAGVRGELDAELVADFDQGFARLRLAHVRDATTAMTRRLTEERRAAFETSLATRNGRLARIGTSAGFDEAGNAAVEAELAAYDAFVDAQGDALSPIEAERFKLSAREDVATSRVTGGFGTLETLAEQQAYLENFRTGWLGGDAALQDLGPDAYGRLTSQMETRIARTEAERDRTARSLSRATGDVVSRLESGFPVPADETAALRRQAEILGDPVLADDVRYMEQVGQWTQTAALRPLPAVNADIAALEAQMSEHGATPRGVALLDTMRSFRDQMETSLARDPLGWASRTGLAPIPALDASTPEALGASLASRADMAETVAERYRLPQPAYLQAHERQFLSEAMIGDPASAATTATAMARALGPDGTAQVLSQIADHAPGLAHAAGAVVGGGDPRVVQYVAQERALSRDPAYTPPSSERSLERALAAETMGSAFMIAPAVEAAALSAARDIYRQLARERGIAPDLNSSNGTVEANSRTLFAEALQLATGRTIGADGRAYGGLIEVNGAMTIAPGAFPAETVERHLRRLTQDQLSSMAPIISANGIPITTRQIQRGQLVAVSDGVYRVNLARSGEPPRFVMGEADYWTLDLRALARIQGDPVPFGQDPDNLVVP